MTDQSYYKSVSILQKELLENNLLRIINSHWICTASFSWFAPASDNAVNKIEDAISMKLPMDFFLFLTTISNGAILYRNIKDDMTGYEIYNTDEFLKMQLHWQKSLEGLWLPHFIAIGVIKSENRPIVMDLKSPTKDQQGCKLLEGNHYDPVSYWVKLSESFHLWIDQLITAQGAQYWLWR